ncbi:MAG: hypothetical protein H6636_01165 [Anaerolineales bacterium]|nr:hypothetical protein [Anaerolineales bacterium]
MLIIMGTTAATMLVAVPAIFQVSKPMNEQVSRLRRRWIGCCLRRCPGWER